ncbi:MAG: tetratricopeptide repeat protein [Bacteroidota bacterium]
MAFFFCHLTLPAQHKKIDSILSILETGKPDTNKVNQLNKLSSEYLNIGEFDSGLKYGNKALALASSILIENKRGWSKGIARAYANIGTSYYYQANYSAALKNYFASLKIMKEIGDKRGIARLSNSIGNIYLEQGEYPPAIKYYMAALKMHADVGDEKSISKTYNNIGNAYSSQDNYPEALKNYFTSLKIREEINDEQGIAISYNNIGAIYDLQGNYTEALKNYFASLRIKEKIGDNAGVANSYNNIGLIYQSQENYAEALKNHFAALKISEDIKYKEGMAVTLENIGAIYSSQGNYPEALKMFFSSLKINEQIGDKYGIAASYNNIGNALVRSGQLKEAQSYLNKALQISMEIGSKYDIKKSYRGLTILDSIQNNWRAAFEHHKLFNVYKDSIDNEETKKKIIETTMTNKFEKIELETKAKQDKKDAIAAEENQRQKNIKYSVTFGLFLVTVFAGFIVRSLRFTNKQKKIIETQNFQIVESINYSKKIQDSLLPSIENMQKAIPSIFVFYEPKAIVSGDFYYFKKFEKYTLLACVDCTGHGVSGGFMSTLGSLLLDKIVDDAALNPSEILNKLNDEIIRILDQQNGGEIQDGMDLSVCLIDRNNHKIEFSGARNGIIVVTNNQAKRYKADLLPVGGSYMKKGIPIERNFKTQHIPINTNDWIYMYTDGFMEQVGGSEGIPMNYSQFENQLLNVSKIESPEEKNKLLQLELDSWRGKHERDDDVLIIGFRVV